MSLSINGVKEIEEITDYIEFGEVDDENTYITKCICGATFSNWDFIISIDSDGTACPNCGRKIFFKNKTKIYLVKEY